MKTNGESSLKHRSWEAVSAILTNLYGKMPEPRIAKLKKLFLLAAFSAKDGVIVELGTWHAAGTIALALGSKVGNNLPVYTVDTYTYRVGWASEVYTQADKDVAVSMVFKAGVDDIVTFVQMDTDKALSKWKLPIGLWFWDLGIDQGSKELVLYDDFMKWEKHIMPGGYAFLRDTYDRRFGSAYALQNLSGFSVIENNPGILVLKKDE